MTESLNNQISEIYISEEKIKKRIAELGLKISEDYSGKNLLMICILKGASVFMSDLIREISLPVSIDFMKVSSYRNSTSSSGEVEIINDISQNIEGLDVIIVEDIIDSGITLSKLVPMLKKRNPASIKICTLLDKPERRKIDIKVDYVGFEIENKFIVGYGLDYAEQFRNLRYIGIYNN